MGEEYVTAPKDIDELSFGDFAGDRSYHTVRDDEVTPYPDTTTRDNKREVDTFLLAPVVTADMVVTCPYDTGPIYATLLPSWLAQLQKLQRRERRTRPTRLTCL